MCLPKLIWPRPRERGSAALPEGQRAKWIHTRLQIATAGDWCQLLDTALKDTPGPRGPEAGQLNTDVTAEGTLQPDTARRVIASVQQDCLFKACEVLGRLKPRKAADAGGWTHETAALLLSEPHSLM